METVNFQCGHCGSLMGVPLELLGQQVRCPTCQQVVRAPLNGAPPAPPAQPPVFASTPPPSEPDSIFTPPEEGGEDLFGSAEAPHVEMPVPEPPPVPPEPPLQDATLTYVPPGAITTPEGRVSEPGFAPGGLAAGEGAVLDGTSAAEATGESVLPQLTSPAVTRARRGGSSWVVPVLIVPLILYSVLATIAVIYLVSLLYLRPQRHPFEMLPDQGDHQGASHVRIDFHGAAKLPVPEQLRVPLEKSLTIGDVKITPLRVELRKVMLRTKGFAKPDESSDDCLCLWLEVENVSRNVVFHPMDPFFHLKRTATDETDPPFTYVEFGSHRLYGGANEAGGKNAAPVTVDGQDYDKELRPGEKMTTFVCTDPEQHVGKYLSGYHGPMLYRIRLRRGLVPFRDKEVSATAVVGVEFSSQDVVAKPTPAT
jgi:hypothetical protein